MWEIAKYLSYNISTISRQKNTTRLHIGQKNKLLWLKKSQVITIGKPN
jgi:hypothetical protein